jgi:hypothetical protein
MAARTSTTSSAAPEPLSDSGQVQFLAVAWTGTMTATPSGTSKNMQNSASERVLAIVKDDPGGMCDQSQ